MVSVHSTTTVYGIVDYIAGCELGGVGGHVTLADTVSLVSFIWSILLIFAVYAGVEK